MHEIIVIGTLPPCPRCRLLSEIVTARVREKGLDAAVRHISYASEEACALAKNVGLTPGTAKNVAAILGEELNIENMPKTANEAQLEFLKDIGPDLQKFSSIFREVNILDNWLRPLENQAINAGILMTPVLIVDGTILHSGSVPAMATIDAWLSELK